MRPHKLSNQSAIVSLWGRPIGLVTAVALLMTTSLFAQPPGKPVADPRPNIVLMIADDMAWDDCTPYGHPQIRTPNLQRLAVAGMRFDNAFLTCSSCSPSRSSIITGRYPHNTGAHQLHLPLPGEQVTFVELLKAAGYYTTQAGKWHLGNPTKPKFDKLAEREGAWVAALAERPRDRPFFAWLAFFDPHRPYAPGAVKPSHTPEQVVVPPYLPDVPETRRDLALYYDEITRMDGDIGRILEELDRQQIADNTLVIFMTDNGRPFPRCKTTIYDSGIKTPLLARWPKGITAGTQSSSLVSSIDLAPTFLALAGVAVPPSFQGVSLEPVFRDPQAVVRPAIFAEHNWHDYEDHGRAVRTLGFKYIRNAYTDTAGTPPADAVRSETFQTMRRLRDAGQLLPAQQGCFTVPRPSEELYDVRNDPHELTNLAADPRYAHTLTELRQTLTAWEQSTGDAVPAERRPDNADRETGERLPGQEGPVRPPKAKTLRAP